MIKTDNHEFDDEEDDKFDGSIIDEDIDEDSEYDEDEEYEDDEDEDWEGRGEGD